MNSKAQMAGIGGIIMVAMSVIVGCILLVAAAQNIGQVKDLATVGNASLGTLTNGTATYITNYKSCSSVKIFNATNDVEIPTNNYTVTNNVVYNGNEAVKITPAVLIDAGYAYNKGTATYQGTCQPLTYDSSSGGRTVAGIIIIFMAIAMVSVVVVYAVKSYQY